MRLAKMVRMYIQFFELKQEDVADELGIPPFKFTRFLNGTHKPKPETLASIIGWCTESILVSQQTPVKFIYVDRIEQVHAQGHDQWGKSVLVKIKSEDLPRKSRSRRNDKPRKYLPPEQANTQ